MFKNKILLITGGTGSFGNAVLKRFLDTELFKEIRIFSRDEKKQDDMRHVLQNPKVKFYIGDVRDKRSVDGAMIDVDYNDPLAWGLEIQKIASDKRTRFESFKKQNVKSWPELFRLVKGEIQNV